MESSSRTESDMMKYTVIHKIINDQSKFRKLGSGPCNLIKR